MSNQCAIDRDHQVTPSLTSTPCVSDEDDWPPSGHPACEALWFVVVFTTWIASFYALMP